MVLDERILACSHIRAVTFVLLGLTYPITKRLHLCRPDLEGLARNGRNAGTFVQSEQIVGQNRQPKNRRLAD